jgi:integrase
MASAANEKIDVRGDGRIILYKREGLKNPKWQVRIRVPNASGYKIVSTKTADIKEAERFALDLYEDLYLHVKAGGSIVSKTFRQVFEEWRNHVTTMGHTRRGGSWDGTIHRVETYALKFFGDMKINIIGEKEFVDFWAWRKANFSKKRPTNGTLRRERTSILPVFKYGLSKGYITKLPETTPPQSKSERRPTFSSKEWKVIENNINQWVKEAKNLATYRDRYVARHCFVILAYTGLRVGELRNLRWGDVWSVRAKTGNYYVGRVSGKTGARNFVFQPGGELCIKQLYKLRCRDLEKLNPELVDPKPPSDGLVICHPDGSPIRSMKHSFESLLRYAGVTQENDGKRRTIYSLRHLYATKRLSNETSPFLLARQMGTSVEMLEKHYGQTVTTTLAAQITKLPPANFKLPGDEDMPF